MKKIILKDFLPPALISIICLIASGCGNVISEKTPIQSKQSSIPTSCSIALSQHNGNKKTDQEIQKYQKLYTASSNNKNQINLLENLGWTYVNKAQESFDPGYYKLAEQTVECMNQHQQDTASALLLQGHILQNLHRFKQAETIARQLVESRGYWYDYGLLGDALMEQGDLSQAIKAYQEMMDQSPGPQAYNRAAYIRWLKGDVDGAIELLNLSANAYAGQKNINAAWTLTRIADFEFQSGQIALSQNYINEVLEKQPDYAPAMLIKGKIKMALGNHYQAISILLRALELNPLPEYRWQLIEALAENKPMQRLRETLQQQLIQTGETEDRRTFALYLANSGIDSKKALALAKLEMNNRQDVFTLDTLAWALRSNQQMDEAKQYSKAALSQGTKSARLYYHAGVIANETGESAEAARLLQLAKELEISLLPSERNHLNQLL